MIILKVIVFTILFVFTIIKLLMMLASNKTSTELVYFIEVLACAVGMALLIKY